MKALALLAAAAILSFTAIACSSDDDLDGNAPNGPLGGTADAGTPPGTGVDDPSRGGPFSDPNDDEDTAKVVAVTQTDEEIVLDSRRIEEGQVTFEITNEGAKAHDFVVIKTDAGADQLPILDGAVDVESPGIEVIDELTGIGAGDTDSLTVELVEGHYVLISNAPGDYELGMRVDISVMPATARR